MRCFQKAALDRVQTNPEEALRERLEFLFRTLNMERSLDVLHGLAGFEGGGGRGCL